MKNIERPEVIQSVVRRILIVTERNGDCDACPIGGTGICDLVPRDIPLKCEETIINWLNSEYVEPHHWEPWELEAMRNIPKRIVYLERRHDTSLPRALQKEDCYSDHGICTQINFPSLKNEKIDIDAELERNGMHR